MNASDDVTAVIEKDFSQHEIAMRDEIQNHES